MPVSATLAANEIIDHKRQSGEYVLPLAFGEAGLPVHPKLAEQLGRHAGQAGYGPVGGVQPLREAAAGYFSRRKLSTDADSIVAGPGSKPLLYALLSVIGGDVVLPQPSWVSYAAQAELLGSTPLLVPTMPGHGGVPDPKRMRDYLDHARAIGRDVRSVVMTLPDNPTGTLAATEVIREACQVARDYDLIIISDEIYRDLVFDAHTIYTSPAEIAGERTVITTGLSKNLALGGWRVGVARLPASERGAQLREGLLTVASEIWSSVPQPMQYAAVSAFEEPDEIRDRIVDSRRLHRIVSRAVAERFTAAGAEVALPDGAFYIYPDFAAWREHLDDRWDARSGAELSEVLLERFGVGVLPGNAFGDGVKELKMRVACSQLYGETDEQREVALRSAYPLMLPWVSRALDHLSQALADLTRP